MNKAKRILSVIFCLVILYCSFSFLAVASWGYDSEGTGQPDAYPAEEIGIPSLSDPDVLREDYSGLVVYYYEKSGSQGIRVDPKEFDFEAEWNKGRPQTEGPWTPYQELMDEMINDRFGFHMSVPNGDDWERSNIYVYNMSLDDYRNWIEEWLLPFCRVTYDSNAVIIEEVGLEFMHIQKPRNLLDQEP